MNFCITKLRVTTELQDNISEWKVFSLSYRYFQRLWAERWWSF